MKHFAKIRLAVFLCIIMVLPPIVSVLPMTAQEVSAASNVYLYWEYNANPSDGSAVRIEKGEKFNIGDYAYVSINNAEYGCASQYKGVKYSTSNKSVLSVNSKGVVTAKKTGTAVIAIRYKGQKITRKIKVVKAGTFKDTTAIKGVRKRIDKISKNMPSKITFSNGYKYLKMVRDYEDYVTKHNTKINRAGMLLEPINFGTGSYNGISGKLAVPQAGKYFALKQLLYDYSDKNSPTSTICSKRLKIAAISANSSAITVTTKQKVTYAHILAAHIETSSYNETLNKKEANILLSVYDKTADTYYSAIGVLKKGSKTVKIKVCTSNYDSESQTIKYVPMKLKKGHTYVIGAKNISWGDGKTVKVK